MKLLFLPLALLCLLVSACAGTLTPRQVVHWPEIRGQVLEEGTEQPIPGAMLVARWSGMGPYSHSECFHVEAATSDVQGNYVIPAWTNHDDSNRLTYQSVQLTVYAPGYVWVRSEGPFTNEETYNTYKNFTDWIEGEARTVKYLRKDTGTVGGRLAYLRNLVNAASCGEGQLTEQEARYKWLTGIYRESTQLAVTEKEKETVGNIRFYSAEMLALPAGESITYKERIHLIENYMKEHLP